MFPVEPFHTHKMTFREHVCKLTRFLCSGFIPHQTHRDSFAAGRTKRLSSGTNVGKNALKYTLKMSAAHNIGEKYYL